MPGALELHVFDEVRQPLLIVVFENRTGLDNEPQLSAVRRLGVRADVIPEAIGQRPNEHVGIDRHLLRQRIRPHRGGGRIVQIGRRLRGCCERRERRDRSQGEERQAEPVPKSQ